MTFQYQGGNMMRGAAIQNQQQQSFFDNLARGIQNYQHGQMMDMKKKKLEAEELERASDPERLANSGFMKVAQGQAPTPNEMAAMKLYDAESMSKVKVDQYGNVHQNQSMFDLIAPRQGVSGMGGKVEPKGVFNFDQIAPQKAPRITNKAEEMQYAHELALKAKEKEHKLKQESKNTETEKKEAEQYKAKEAFDDTLEEVLADLDELYRQGGAKSEKQSILQNTLSSMANAPVVGDLTQSIFDPETQTLRDKIEGRRPVLFNAIKKASGLTGTELNSQYEVENQLKQLGNNSMTYEARRDLLEGLSRIFGTGRLSGGDVKPQKPPSKPKLTKEQALQMLRERGRIQ